MRKISYIAFLFLLGAAGSLGFAPHYLWHMTAGSIGLAYYLLKDRGYGRSFWWGAGYGIANFYWLLGPLFDPDKMHFYIAGMSALFVISGVLFGGPFALAKVTGEKGWRRTLYFALGVAFILWMREAVLFTILMWNPLANLALPFPWLSNAMSVVGALGLTFIVAGAIAAIPEYFLSKSKIQFLFFVPILFFAFSAPGYREIPSGKTVRIVQPATSVADKENPFANDRRMAALLELTFKDLALTPDLIVWPETAYPYRADMTARLMPLGAKLAFGAVYTNGDKLYNSLLYAGKNGRIADAYHKVHLVPFSEYPLFGLNSGTDFQKGAPRVVDDFVPLICYDVAYSDMLIPRSEVQRPRYIILATNTAHFDAPALVRQYVDMARRQAIETGLPVLLANNAGMSMIIDYRGNILQSLGMDTAGYLDGVIPPHRMTPYRQIGLNRVMLWIILLSGFVLVAFRRPRRQHTHYCHTAA
ncbi:MAG: apolipoprotein N-acyltransferase [Rickettsiales bacterium]|jgi:apolipoprotein N-acyltransferase|nr:apolipoprotein N-acyltransferase [Rickettsiales bacterium]